MKARHSLEGHADATASEGAAIFGVALAGMLADGAAVQRGATCKEALPYVLRLAGAMPGFSLLSDGVWNHTTRLQVQKYYTISWEFI